MTVADLKPGDFFIPLTKSGERQTKVAFLFDDENRYTRTWDGAYVDSFFADKSYPVTLVTKVHAIQLAKTYREV